MEKIAVMGGTFNPIHNGHLAMAYAALNDFPCDRVLFMTGGNPPHKHNGVLDAAFRYDMVELAIKDEPRFFASDYEVQKQSRCYTSETMEYLQTVFPKAKLYFIIGADSLADLESWHDTQKLFAITEFLVFSRAGKSIDMKAAVDRLACLYGAQIHCLAAEIPKISSTEIRACFAEGRISQAAQWLPRTVFPFIEENHFYRGGGCIDN